MASRSDLPNISWRERRIGGKRSHGGAGLCLRGSESREHLVSDQPSCRSRLLSIAENGARTAVFISFGQLPDCLGSARPRFHACRCALRRNASHVRAATDRARRTYCPSVVVG